MGVVRATETLHLRVLGLPSPASGRTEKFNVQFQLPVERHLPMHYALPGAQQALSQGGWLNSMLFPTNQDCEIQESLHPGVFTQNFFDRDLNWEQKKAVESIWSRSHGTLPYLISGPPGTGKTKTIIEATLQLVKNSADCNHVLLCAPSDPAADTLCQRLIGHLNPSQMLRLNRPCRTFAGDEHQLRPRISLVSSPLKESLFARIFRRPVYADHPLSRGKKGEAPPPLTQSLLPVFRPAFANLIRNYRSHPAILAVLSNLFYFDSLEPEARDPDRLASWEGWQGRGWPVLFHDNRGLDELELPGLMEGTGGWHNPEEADAACSYAQSLVGSGLVEQNEVCIMSPFKAQVRRLRNCMRQSEYGGLWDVNIGPTEAFQGLERGVVILCVTRARGRFVQEDKKLGWGIIGMPNKVNVALTRAKYGLIVVGNQELLVDDPNWRAFLDFCDRNGLVARPKAMNGTHGHDEARLTRLERWLVHKETMGMHTPRDRAWGMFNGVQPGQEMWAGGMLETPGLDENDRGGYDSAEDA